MKWWGVTEGGWMWALLALGVALGGGVASSGKTCQKAQPSVEENGLKNGYDDDDARFDEIPSITLKDIKKTKRYGWTDTQTDNVITVYPPTNTVCGGLKKNFSSPEPKAHR